MTNFLILNNQLMILIIDLLMLMIIITPNYFNKFHPLILSIILTIYTIILSLKLNYMNNSFWYSYIIYLIIVGGIMILFLYLTAISNNEFFQLNNFFFMNYMLKIIMFFFIINMMKNYLGEYNFFIMYNNNDYSDFMKINKSNFLDYKNLYMKNTLHSNIYLISYLFLTMLCCILICLKMATPLRQII